MEDRRGTARWALFWVIVAIVTTAGAFTLLAQRFEYDDVLRKPPGEVLGLFHAAGPSLVFIWLSFAMGVLLLAPVAVLLERATPGPASRWLSAVAIASAVLQAVGLLRWVFVVPLLARGWSSTSVSPATRETLEWIYQAVHQYGGVILGEWMGQLLLVAWTLGFGLRLARSGGTAARVLGWAAWVISAVWIAGFTELLGTVIPGMTVIEAGPIAFTVWQFWLVAVAVQVWRAAQSAASVSAAAGKV